MAPGYDIFLSYNSRDQTAVREIHEKLKARGLKPWFDREALTPGRLWQAEAEKGLRSCRAAAVFIGPSGIGPWENLEMRVLLTRAAQEGLPLIPVFLPGAPDKLELPGFLAEFGWVDLRGGITEEGIEKLVRGIPRTRKRPKSPAKLVSGTAGDLGCRTPSPALPRCAGEGAPTRWAGAADGRTALPLGGVMPLPDRAPLPCVRASRPFVRAFPP